jgi:hypothetical protein
MACLMRLAPADLERSTTIRLLPKRRFSLVVALQSKTPGEACPYCAGGLIALGVRRTGVRQFIYVAADG